MRRCSSCSIRATWRGWSCQGVGAGAPRVRESGDKKYQLRRFVARAARAMTEMDTRGAQGSRAAQNGRADGLGRSSLLRARARLVARTAFAAVWDNLGMAVRSKVLSYAFLCILAAGGVAAALIWRPKAPVVLASGTILAPARPLADFSLIDNQGRSLWRG